MNELHPRDRWAIDLMLSHVNQNRVEAAYNRAELLARRCELAAEWADLVLEGATPLYELVALRRK